MHGYFSDTDSVMHLDFDETLESRKHVVDDKSGNGNEADLANGAILSTRSLGKLVDGILGR